MRFQAFGISDTGLNRTINQDAWVSLPNLRFFALADGMGGHQAGKIAAEEALEKLSHFVSLIPHTDCMEMMIELRHAIQKTNLALYNMSQESAHLKGMGTTLCCVICTDLFIVYAHLGDSRIYRLRNQKLELLTVDHSFFAKWLATGKLAEDCKTPYPYKHVITRALGLTKTAKPDVCTTPYLAGDQFLLCSDGLSNVLSQNKIEIILNECPDPVKACERLLEQAKIEGNLDNTTLLMIHESKENLLR